MGSFKAKVGLGRVGGVFFPLQAWVVSPGHRLVLSRSLMAEVVLFWIAQWLKSLAVEPAFGSSIPPLDLLDRVWI